jgi:hypothetical protein
LKAEAALCGVAGASHAQNSLVPARGAVAERLRGQLMGRNDRKYYHKENRYAFSKTHLGNRHFSLGRLTPTFAQETQPAARAGQEVTVVLERRQVRFATRSNPEWVRLQVHYQSGELVYDSNPTPGGEINWSLQDADSQGGQERIVRLHALHKRRGQRNRRARS